MTLKKAPFAWLWTSSRAGLAAFVLLATCATAAFAIAAPTDKRVALVIGNGAYQHAPALGNPVGDAKAVSAALRRLGLDVTEGYDLSERDMRALLIKFADSMVGAKGALVYYAGHGVALDGVNYMLPVDIDLKSPADLDVSGVSVDIVLRQMRRDERVNIIILDACRDNPFAAALARAAVRAVVSSRGLQAIDGDLARGALIAFATGPGSTALDGPVGDHSPFTSALLRHIGDPGEPIETVMHKVREEVFASTNSKQLPWVNTSIVGDFELNPAPAGPPIKPAPENVSPSQATENLLWESAERSGAAEDYQSYLDAFPSGVFAPLAKRRIAHGSSGEAQETALRFNLADRMAAQASLAQQDLKPGPADGVFGEATRAAIRVWQVREGYAATGYLDREQMARLNADAAPRAASLNPAPKAIVAPKPAAKFIASPPRRPVVAIDRPATPKYAHRRLREAPEADTPPAATQPREAAYAAPKFTDGAVEAEGVAVEAAVAALAQAGAPDQEAARAQAAAQAVAVGRIIA